MQLLRMRGDSCYVNPRVGVWISQLFRTWGDSYHFYPRVGRWFSQLFRMSWYWWWLN